MKRILCIYPSVHKIYCDAFIQNVIDEKVVSK